MQITVRRPPISSMQYQVRSLSPSPPLPPSPSPNSSSLFLDSSRPLSIGANVSEILGEYDSPPSQGWLLVKWRSVSFHVLDHGYGESLPPTHLSPFLSLVHGKFAVRLRPMDLLECDG
jgi:hypothetical protein